jgi:hypothetical protein
LLVGRIIGLGSTGDDVLWRNYRKIAGLLGAAAALTTMATAQAAPAQDTRMAPATSYRDLLDPIPNALPKLVADDVQRSEMPRTELAQLSVRIGRGHHHHHHHHWWYHHHHHFFGYHHHHHHHHHFYRGY